MILSNARHRLIISITLAFLGGCGLAPPAATPRPTRPVATLFPTAAIVLPTSAATYAATPSLADTGWITGGAGTAVRHMRAAAGPDRLAAPLVIVRIDLSRVRLRVAYTPDRPRGLRSWFEDERPLLAVNGSFFTKDYRATALLISDGIASGASYEGFGGMLAVAPDGNVSLRPLRDQPYDSNEQLDQAMQSFPMLVFPGGTPTDFDDNDQRARRIALALDRAGRLLVIVSPTSDFTLLGLAEWIRRSDLDVDRALNLDGGPSTGLYLKDGELNEQIDSLGLLPIVLLVEPK